LDLHEALDIAIHVASALVAAHRVKIVHRDIKPENIMVRRDDGLVKVLDFGLAKAMGKESAATPDSDIPTRPLVNTAPGIVMGTVAYMSPEQARGQVVDERTDIWSVGVVLYEMIAGKVPFAGTGANEVISEILSKDQPAPLARFAHDLPAELERIVSKALRKQREQRYQTVKDLLLDLQNLKQELEVEARLRRSDGLSVSKSEGAGSYSRSIVGDEGATRSIDAVTRQTSSAEYLVSELKRHRRSALLVVAAMIIGVVALVYFYSVRRRVEPPAASIDAIDSVAVLPFINESKDPNAEYLSDGLSDSIINRLSQLSNLRVTSLNAALRYKGQTLDAPAIGRDLKVRAVLIGWLTKRGNELSVRTELVDVRDNRRLWGEQYNNRKLADLLQVQEEIARQISEKLRVRLTGEDQQRLVKSETKNSEAYQLYLQGRFYWNKYTDDGFRKSIGFFKQRSRKILATRLAYSGLADSYSLLGEMSFAPPERAFRKREYTPRGRWRWMRHWPKPTSRWHRKATLRLGLAGGGEGIPARQRNQSELS
jgi:serine/threonine-protein kinase